MDDHVDGPSPVRPVQTVRTVAEGSAFPATAALAEAWSQTLAEVGIEPSRAVTRQGTALLQRWAQGHRRYHDRTHLSTVLDALETLCEPDVPPPAVRLGAWFHDAVYDGHPGHDEQASADLAQDVLGKLGVDEGTVAEVRRLIGLTSSHDCAEGDADGALLVDADLSILGSGQMSYRRYARDVRAEYAHVTDEDFRAGRIAVLTRLLDRPHLFRTARGAAMWEQPARANMAAECRRLEAETKATRRSGG